MARTQSEQRDYDYRRRYGITLAQYEELLKFQNGVCFICRRKPVTRRLVVDHDHKKIGIDSVRGLLCGHPRYGCNIALGSFRDDPDTLDRAADYLRDPPAQRYLTRSEVDDTDCGPS